jgi:hypothetical protein
MRPVSTERPRHEAPPSRPEMRREDRISKGKENLLLAALPRRERERLDPFLEPVEAGLRDVLIEANEPITHLFFPYDAVTSTIQELGGGASIETGLMGVEGVIGIQLWLRTPSTPSRTIVQIAGAGHRMSAKNFVGEVLGRPSSPLNDLMARYTHAFLSMTSLTAACNRVHRLDQRMCRWLKLLHNRVRRDEFPMRQEFMAMMLGVHRPTVSTTANMLQQAGLIGYTRGRMKILDPEGLGEGACECYGLMKKEMDRVFDRPWREFAREQDEKGR